MYAIIQACGRQYKVSEGQTIAVEKVENDVGANVTFDQVLLIGGNGTPKIGTPTVQGASVVAEVLRNGKAKKIIVFKRMKRKGFHKTRGHRQLYTEIKITTIKG